MVKDGQHARMCMCDGAESDGAEADLFCVSQEVRCHNLIHPQNMKLPAIAILSSSVSAANAFVHTTSVAAMSRTHGFGPESSNGHSSRLSRLASSANSVTDTLLGKLWLCSMGGRGEKDTGSSVIEENRQMEERERGLL